MAADDGRSQTAPQLVVEQRFAIVPEWLLDADVGDCAVRLYAVLLRYGNSSGARMPGRATLARRLHKRSTDTVDRAMRQLVGLGAVVVEHRHDGRQRLTNRYQLRTTRPAEPSAEPSRAGGRTDTATRTRQGRGGRTVAARGGRNNAAGVAARMRHDRESLTESTPPPPAPHPATARAGSAPNPGAPVVPGVTVAKSRDALVADCEIDEWDQFIQLIRDRRQTVGGRLGSWTGAHLLAALHLAIRNRGWPPAQAARALLAVTSDPETQRPGARPGWPRRARGGTTPVHPPERPPVLRRPRSWRGWRPTWPARAGCGSDCRPRPATPSPARGSRSPGPPWSSVPTGCC